MSRIIDRAPLAATGERRARRIDSLTRSGYQASRDSGSSSRRSALVVRDSGIGREFLRAACHVWLRGAPTPASSRIPRLQ